MSVGDRIQQLETLVQSLVHQQQQQTPQIPSEPPGGSISESAAQVFWSKPAASPQSVSGAPSGAPEGKNPVAPTTDDDIAIPLPPSCSNGMRDLSSTPSECGSTFPHSHSASYVGSVHWAAVLDSISELKDQYEREEEARTLASADHVPQNNSGPRLLYEPVQATRAEVLASIPARPVVDRMVARYFNAQQNTSLPIVHSGYFLREV